MPRSTPNAASSLATKMLAGRQPCGFMEVSPPARCRRPSLDTPLGTTSTDASSRCVHRAFLSRIAMRSKPGMHSGGGPKLIRPAMPQHRCTGRPNEPAEQRPPEGHLGRKSCRQLLVRLQRPRIQSRGAYECPSDDWTDRVTDRRHFDPWYAATAELYRRDLPDHYRSLGTVRQRQLSSVIVRAPYNRRSGLAICGSAPRRGNARGAAGLSSRTFTAP